MSLLTRDDWMQWGIRGSIAGCDEQTRDRLQQFVAIQVAKNIQKLPEWLRSRLREYLEANVDGRRRCATAFDSYMTKGRKRECLLRCVPKEANPTPANYASAFSGYAAACVKSMFNEVLRKEAPPEPHGGRPPVELDGPIKIGEETTHGEILPDVGATMDDILTLREVKRVAFQMELNERECLILWADYHGEPRCSEKMQKLANCGRAQLSACAKQLELRILSEIIRVFQLASHEEPRAATWTYWAWEALGQKFVKISPEMDPNGDLIWSEPGSAN